MLDFSSISLAINWWLIGSYRTGELIVNAGISVIDMLINAVRSFNIFAVLLYEGSSLWLEDVSELLCGFEELILDGYNYLLEIGASLAAIIAKIVYTPFSIIAEILSSTRELLLLLGSSCLFLISLPPLFLFYFIDTLLHAFKTVGSFARYAAKRFSDHATDLQTLEALLGLAVGCGLIIITINGMKFLGKSYFKLKNRAVRALRRTWTSAKTRVTTARRKQGRNKGCKPQEAELCIVCFEEARSVCFLPCRHLSLCVTCTESLSYPLKCPLCRQRAEDLIHVYL